jgi:hypothetical protein
MNETPLKSFSPVAGCARKFVAIPCHGPSDDHRSGHRCVRHALSNADRVDCFSTDGSSGDRGACVASVRRNAEENRETDDDAAITPSGLVRCECTWRSRCKRIAALTILCFELQIELRRPSKRCRPHLAAGIVVRHDGRLSGLRSPPASRSRSHRAARRARRDRSGAPGRSSPRRRHLR